MLKNFLILIFIVLFINNSYAGKKSVGTTSMNFLKIGFGARATGMGNAFTAIDNDINSVYWNPAGITTIRKKTVSFMHLNWFADISYNELSIIYPLKKSVLGISLAFLNYGDIQRTLADDNGKFFSTNGTYESYDRLLNFSYAFNITDKILLGFNSKIIQEKIDDESAEGIAFDIGSIIKFSSFENFSLGMLLQNLGKTSNFHNESDPLPLTFKLGLKYSFLSDRIIIANDIVVPNDNDPYLNCGVEYSLLGKKNNFNFILRSGFSTLGNKNDQKDYNVGFGIKTGNLNIDYAYLPFELLDNSHKISLNYSFGKIRQMPEKEKYLNPTQLFHLAKLIKNGNSRKIYLVHPTAKTVSILGSFNNWIPDIYKLKKNNLGIWEIDLKFLKKGAYYYVFYVNNQIFTDPHNIKKVSDNQGHFVNILFIK